VKVLRKSSQYTFNNNLSRAGFGPYEKLMTFLGMRGGEGPDSLLSPGGPQFTVGTYATAWKNAYLARFLSIIFLE